jgi:hypothetical protein
MQQKTAVFATFFTGVPARHSGITGAGPGIVGITRLGDDKQRESRARARRILRFAVGSQEVGLNGDSEHNF